MSVWTIEYTVFAECLGVALVCSMLGTYFAKTRWLRHASIGVSAFGLVVWVLSGLAKVVLEMH
jgi:tellurite resistance protein TehA-like permease